MYISAAEATKIILNKNIVALPTETVYGLAGDATSDVAVSKIFNAKGRPSYNPLIIHVPSVEEAMIYGEFSNDARKIASKFWPGPITLVTKLISKDLSKHATAGLNTVALRVPANDIFKEIMLKSGVPLAAPSANISSKISPTRPEHIVKSFSGNVPVVDGGKTLYGLESTVLDCTETIPKILRHGFIRIETLSLILGKNVEVNDNVKKINAPGMLKKHYSPDCLLRINAGSAALDEIALNFASSNLGGNKQFNLSPQGNLIEAASNLYHFMQLAEEFVIKNKLKGIAIANIPEEGLGIAINDKLKRATAK